MYAILTDDNFRCEVLESPVPVLVAFGAVWCGGSHIMAPVLEKLACRYATQLKIGRLNVDTNVQIPTQYGVRELPTLLFFKRGRLVGRILGAVSGKTLEARILSTLLSSP